MLASVAAEKRDSAALVRDSTQSTSRVASDSPACQLSLFVFAYLCRVLLTRSITGTQLYRSCSSGMLRLKFEVNTALKCRLWSSGAVSISVSLVSSYTQEQNVKFVFCVEVAGSEKFSFDLIDFLLLYL
jgi:hypothetical protein